MFRRLGLTQEAQPIEFALATMLQEGQVLTGDLCGSVSTAA
jgi:hypothetical protein